MITGLLILGGYVLAGIYAARIAWSHEQEDEICRDDLFLSLMPAILAFLFWPACLVGLGLLKAVTYHPHQSKAQKLKAAQEENRRLQRHIDELEREDAYWRRTHG